MLEKTIALAWHDSQHENDILLSKEVQLTNEKYNWLSMKLLLLVLTTLLKL